MHNKLKSPEAIMTVFGAFDGYPVNVSENAQGCGLFIDMATLFETEFNGPMVVGFRNSLTGGKQKEVQKLYHEAMEILSDKESLAREVSKGMSIWRFLDNGAINSWIWDYPILVKKIGKTRSVVARSKKYPGYYRIFGDRMGVITAKYISLDQSWYDKWVSLTNQSAKGVTQEGPIDAPGLVTERVDLR